MTPLLRQARRAVWLSPLALAGFVLAALPYHASADLIPLPTLTTPIGTLTLPTVSTPPLVVPTTIVAPTTTAVPTTTTAATTTAATTTAAAATPDGAEAPAGGTADASAGSGAAPSVNATPKVAGELRLANGAVSIPVTSVRSPERLLVRLLLSSKTLRSSKQRITALTRVTDTRGYLVRGARVAMVGSPSGRLHRFSIKASTSNGEARFSVQLRPAKLTRGSVALRVTAGDAFDPKAAIGSVKATVAVRPVVR